jgi:NAD(P)H-hydrate epimerase
MARLTGTTIAKIQTDPIGHLQQATRHFRATIVLKGAASTIGFPDGRVFINRSGCDGMATAGSGDVLTGTIAAMYGLGLPFEDAVCKGVLVHGLAGELAAGAVGADGVTASQILVCLPRAVRHTRQAAEDAFAERDWIPRLI